MDSHEGKQIRFKIGESNPLTNEGSITETREQAQETQKAEPTAKNHAGRETQMQGTEESPKLGAMQHYQLKCSDDRMRENTTDALATVQKTLG